MIIHCFFEQSGTFKNEFKKLGFLCYDYDILNDFNQTDYKIDIFVEIEKAFLNKQSIFDKINKDDLIIAFFPCIRFVKDIQLHFRGEAFQLKNSGIETKLLYDLKLHQELHDYYNLITKLVIICIRRKLKLIIENPYSKNHYLSNYWCIKPSIIDKDRSLKGDYFKKPTQYWFINTQPKQNMILESQIWNKVSKDIHHCDHLTRSLISSDYAYRFIKEYIL